MLRLLADADVDRRVVSGLRRIENEIDFEIAEPETLKGLPDSLVLEFAANSDRVLVSHDRRTMATAFYAFIRDRQSPGLLLLKQTCPIGRAIDELRLCATVLSRDELINRVFFLPL